MIWNLRAALHLDLERFYDQMGVGNLCPDPSAFSKARIHLKASAFRELNDQLIEIAGAFGLRDNTWDGLRLLAVDGSTLRLPKASPEIAAHFGGPSNQQGSFLPMARMSYLYEVRTDVVIDAQISPYKQGEKAQAHELLGGNVWEGDCTLFDRGYNDPRIVAWSIAQDSHFVIRVTVGNSKAAQAFVKSGKSDSEHILTFTDDIIEKFRDNGLQLPKSVRLRFVRVPLDTGEVEVLLTNLIDREKYPATEFKPLYHERWDVEEGIKTSKCKIEVENWTGKSVASIYQDFYARILCQNIAASLALTAQPELEEKTKDCQGAYQINMKRAIGVIRDQFCGMMKASKRQLRELLSKVSRRLLKSACIVRPGRSYPRGTPRRIPPSMAYKPIA